MMTTQPDQSLEKKILSLVDELGSFTWGYPEPDPSSVCSGNHYGDCQYCGLNGGTEKFRIENLPAQEQALEQLLAYPKETAIPILFLSDKLETNWWAIRTYAKRLATGWEVKNPYLASLATTPSNPPSLRRNALIFLGILPRAKEDTEGLSNTLFSIAISEAPDLIRLESLKALYHTGPPSPALQRTIRSLSYPWSTGHNWNPAMKSFGLGISCFPTFIESLLISGIIAGCTYLIGSAIQSHESLSFSQALSESHTIKTMVTGMVGLVSFGMCCGSRMDSPRSYQ